MLRRSDRSTSRTTSTLLVRDPMLNERFEVLAKVRCMERLLADDGGYLVLSRSMAVPTQTIFVGRSHKEHEYEYFRFNTPRLLPWLGLASHLPIDVSCRTLSITIPTVSAKRTGL
jgi:hypothetical protein